MNQSANAMAVQVFAPEFTTAEAIQYEPLAIAQFEERGREHEKAKELSASRKAVCDDNDATVRYSAALQRELTAGLQKLVSESRAEFFGTRESCDVEALGALIGAKQKAAMFVDDAYGFMLEVKGPLDRIAWLDAVANQANAEYAELTAAMVCSRVRTLARLGPVIESEGAIGVVGAATERLRMEADAAKYRAERAELAAREARQAFEKQQVSLASRGMVTRGTVGRAI